jgi:glycosyltransferase involved in cell wall biosynthesis
MRIAQVMAGAPTGGAELFYERLTAALARAGEQVLPVIRRDPGRAGRLRAEGLQPVELSFGGPLDLLTAPRLGRTLREFAPRVTVAWMNRAAHFTPAGAWVLAGRLGGFYDLGYYRRCDHLIGNTRGIVDWITAQGWPAHRAHYLPNFVPDMLEADPAPLPCPPGAPVVLALGRLHRNKAFDTLIRALRHLPGIHAVIAGEGPERAALTALAQSEGVADRLHLLGWRQDTAALLAACDVMVCPSRHEPLGNVVIEGWSARRPVVAAASQGPSELIVSGESGLLTPIDNAAALADAIRGIIGTQAGTTLAAAGRLRYESEFAEAQVVERWRRFLATAEKASAEKS